MFGVDTQQLNQQYAAAHDSGDYSGIDPDQATNHVQQFMQNAPPDMQQLVFQQYFEQMPQDQRDQVAQKMPSEYGANSSDPQTMAQGFQQMGQQQSGMISQILSGIVGGRQGYGGIGSLAGLAAKALLGHGGGAI